MEQLVEEKSANGPFTTLDDFASRIDPRSLNRRQLESLAGGGAKGPGPAAAAGRDLGEALGQPVVQPDLGADACDAFSLSRAVP